MRYMLKILLLIFIFPLSTFNVAHSTVKKNLNNRKTQLNLISHKAVKSGDNLYSILKAHGFPRTSANKIISQQKHLKRFSLSPGHKYTVEKKRHQISLSFYIDLGKKIVLWHSFDTKKFGYKKNNDGLRVKKQTVYGKVRGSLFGSIGKYIKDPLVPYKFQDAFLLHYNLKRVIQPNAKFSFTVERKYHGKTFMKYGKILKASLQINNKIVRRTLVKHPDGFSYIGNESEKNRPLYSPVDYMHFASMYERRRFHPVRKRYMAHQGIDFALAKGRPIYAVQPGKVTKKGYNRSAGNYIAIKHSGGLTSYYNHLSRHSKKIRRGQQVKVGQTIGWIGCTGSCTKAHLHFAVKKNNRFVNPVKLIKSYPYKAKKNISVHIARSK